LTGGGLIRSAGRRTGVATLRSGNTFRKSYERIPGDGNFVEKTLTGAQEQVERRYRLRMQAFDVGEVADRVGETLAVEKPEVFFPGKKRRRVAARSLLCYRAAEEPGISQSLSAQMLKISPAAVTACVQRGERAVKGRGYCLQ
jgi:hypothetical protein